MKSLLEKGAALVKGEWHGQQAHRAAVCLWFLDKLNVQKPEQRQLVAAEWMKLQGGLGANASQLAQLLGRPTQKAKLEATFGQF